MLKFSVSFWNVAGGLPYEDIAAALDELRQSISLALDGNLGNTLTVS